MRILVDKTDSVSVMVYCWEVDDDVEASHLKSEVPQDVSVVEQVEFTFRKPGHSDSNTIIRNSNLKVEGEDTSLNVTAFQEMILKTLLHRWDLKDNDGKKVPLNTVSINNLVPSVARAAVAGALNRINI